ncbi:MAG: hypothetical protein Q4A61_06495 [Porphyromonadaceae bacterium]|nr:hypothetical protein [Porphyromonadaceae bacterium]
MLQQTGGCSLIFSTAAQPAYAAHFIQVGDKYARMLRLGYTGAGMLVLEPFIEEVSHTIFVSGTIRLIHEVYPETTPKQEITQLELTELVAKYDGWQIVLP